MSLSDFPDAFFRYVIGIILGNKLSKKISLRNLRKLDNLDPFKTLEKYRGWGKYHLMIPEQSKKEIIELINLVKKIKPKTILEIGTGIGGTLYLWSKYLTPTILIGIDLPDLHPIRLNRDTKELFKESDVVSIRGDSQSSDIVQKVKEKLNDKKVDFLFIDADHKYEGVKKDFENYSPLVRQGGIIAFHDIAMEERGEKKVPTFWNEIKHEYDTREIIKSECDVGLGIGVIFKWQK